MSFHDLLNDLMVSYGMTNAKLAEQVGVSESAVKKWRKGIASPSLDNADKIADAFLISIDQLSGRTKVTGSSNKSVPVIGRIQAGSPIESYEGHFGTIILPNDVSPSADLFALEIVGDSMMPIFMEGDIIICEKIRNNYNNKFCVITIDGESTLKKLKVDSSGVTLVPLNPLYKEIHFSKQDAEEKGFRVDGAVIESIRKF